MKHIKISMQDFILKHWEIYIHFWVTNHIDPFLNKQTKTIISLGKKRR